MANLLEWFEKLVADVLEGASPSITFKWPLPELKFDLAGLKNLRVNRLKLSLVVDECFTSRRIYHDSVSVENFGATEDSADEIRVELDKHARELAEKAGDNSATMHLLLAWKGCVKGLLQVVRTESAKHGRGAMLVVSKDATEALAAFRRDVLPFIALLIPQCQGLTRERAREAYGKTVALLSGRDMMAVYGAISDGT